MDSPPPTEVRAGGARATWLALLLAGVIATFGAVGVSMERSLGWDESMHAGLPAARVALAVGAGELREAADVVLDCQQYPPAYPLYLAAAQGLSGVDERVARGASRALWALGLFGLMLLGRAVVERLERDGRGVPRGAGLVPWVLPALALCSPMAWAFSGTLFLEAPFLTVAAFALWAWMRRDGARGRAQRWRRDLLAGALLCVAFFTKFNYALLLGFGLFLDLSIESVAALRGGRGRIALERALALASPSALGWGWWFVLPLPAGSEVAASHREAFLAFLSGNTQLGTTPYAYRVWDAATLLAPSATALALTLVSALLALRFVRRPAVRTLVLLALATWGPVLAHNFHLDRFFLPPALALWSLAAVGLAAALPTAAVPRAAALAVLTVGALAAGRVDGPALAGALGLRNADNAEYIDGLMAERRALGPWRSLPTAGLRRGEHDALVDAIAEAAGPADRVGWIGVNSELSPAALHLGLLARGGSPERLRRDAGRVRPDGQPEMVVSFFGTDPGWDAALLRGWASGFDLVLSTEPLDWKGRSQRAYLGTYRGWLFEGGAWDYTSIASVDVARAGGRTTTVELFACRPVGE